MSEDGDDGDLMSSKSCAMCHPATSLVWFHDAFTPHLLTYDCSGVGIRPDSGIWDEISELDYFECTFDAALMNYIVSKTNKYYTSV